MANEKRNEILQALALLLEAAEKTDDRLAGAWLKEARDNIDVGVYPAGPVVATEPEPCARCAAAEAAARNAGVGGGIINPGPLDLRGIGQNEEDNDDFDPLRELENEVNGAYEQAVDDAYPAGLELVIATHPDSDLVVTQAIAREVAELVLPTMNDVIGQLGIGNIALNEGVARVSLTLAEGEDRSVLGNMGAGQDAFNAAIPIAGGIVQVTSRVNDPANPELAEELGLVREEQEPRADGRHQINNVLDVYEEVAGERPQAEVLRITYRREDNQELSQDQTNTIIDHPISQMGLQRLGNMMLVGIDPGMDPASKVAVFGAVGDGEIDPAVLGLGAAAYRGRFNFGPGIGMVSANAEVQLAGAEVPVM